MLTLCTRIGFAIVLGVAVKLWRGVVGEPKSPPLPLIRCDACWRLRPMGDRCVCGARVAL